jgi:NADH dehydrogenase FAD-containing subunit
MDKKKVLVIGGGFGGVSRPRPLAPGLKCSW